MTYNRRRSPRFRRGLVILSTTLIVPFNAQAQYKILDTSPEVEQDEVIVYAYKNKTPLLEIPNSISVLTSDYLEQRRYRTLEQISAAQPGVTLSKNSNAGKVFVRGIGSQGNAGMEQSAATFIDGVYYGRSRTIKAALSDLEQIEILKGPQSVQLGVNSSAGAISVKTRSAVLGESSGYVEASFGNYNTRGMTAAYNLPLGDDLALRGVVNVDSSDGFWDMVNPLSGEVVSEDSGHDSQLFRVSGLWQPSESFHAQMKAEIQNTKRDNPYSWQPGGCDNLYGLGLSNQAELDGFWTATGSMQSSPLRLPFSCAPDFLDSRFDGRSPTDPFNSSEYHSEILQANLSWELGGLQLTSLTSAYEAEFGFEGNDLTHGAPTQRRYLWTQDNNQQISQEFRLSSLGGDPLQWMIGAYWHSGDINYATGDADRRSMRRTQFIHTQAVQDEKMTSLFSQIDWQLDTKLSLDLGLRWTEVQKTFSGSDAQYRAGFLPQNQRGPFMQVLGADISGNPSAYADFEPRLRNQFIDETRKYSHLLPSIALRYRPNTETNFYYRWTKGAKAGGFNFRLSGLDETTLDFDSEIVSAHEIGVKARFLNQKLTLGAAAFLSDYRNLQQNSNRGDDGVISAAVIRNAAKASSNGIELELSWKAAETLTLDLAASVLDAQFDDYQGADCTRFQSVISSTDVAAQFGAQRFNNRCAQDLSGGRLAHAPEFSSRTALIWDLPLGGDLGLSSTLEWIYSDGFFTSPHADPLRRQDAFHKFNARIALVPDSDHWTLDLVATNLTNKLTARQLGQDQDAAVSGLLDDPRRISLNFRYLFE